MHLLRGAVAASKFMLIIIIMTISFLGSKCTLLTTTQRCSGLLSYLCIFYVIMSAENHWWEQIQQNPPLTQYSDLNFSPLNSRSGDWTNWSTSAMFRIPWWYSLPTATNCNVTHNSFKLLINNHLMDLNTKRFIA